MEIQVGAILLQMVNFGIVVGAITFLLLKPVRKILDERSRKIEEGLDASERAVKREAELETLAKKAEQSGLEKAKGLVDEARKDAKSRRAEIIAKAEAEAAEIIAKAQQDGESLKQNMLGDLQAQFETSVVAVSKQIIGAELSTKQHQDLIQKSLQEIKAA
jgi:F-type H+-transporting ATPase subunit b